MRRKWSCSRVKPKHWHCSSRFVPSWLLERGHLPLASRVADTVETTTHLVYHSKTRMDCVSAPNPTTLEQQDTPIHRIIPFEWTKELTLQLIEKYRELRCLWEVKSDIYKNRSVKSDAYNTLFQHMKALHDNCTLDIVKKKINTLRSQYRKEKKLLISSKKSGAGTDEIYATKLWCFSQLEFLTDGEIQRESTSTMDSLQEVCWCIFTSTNEVGNVVFAFLIVFFFLPFWL